MIRLDKLLADAGAGTHSEVKEYIRKGRVTVNGQVCKKPEQKVAAKG
ncbi:MAG: 16S rRNA pseudouridine(516) synthase, partial [Acetatifactor sp.]|nr:16S rRNA pseudouridine(516) synthase [Acetatifactor sp.]